MPGSQDITQEVPHTWAFPHTATVTNHKGHKMSRRTLCVLGGPNLCPPLPRGCRATGRQLSMVSRRRAPIPPSVPCPSDYTPTVLQQHTRAQPVPPRAFAPAVPCAQKALPRAPQTQHVTSSCRSFLMPWLSDAPSLAQFYLPCSTCLPIVPRTTRCHQEAPLTPMPQPGRTAK